jgi:hypothetical protein
MKEITKIDEVIDRLLASGFDFRLEDKKLIIRSCPNREKSTSVLGFSYWGYFEEFYFDLEEHGVSISDLIYDAFNEYKEYVRDYLKNGVSGICEKL